MSFVITQACIGKKATECEKVCPVDCIHPREDELGFEQVEQLYIDPRLCINCGACMAVCPVLAIYPEESVPAPLKMFTKKNVDHFRLGSVSEFHNKYPVGQSRQLIKDFNLREVERQKASGASR